MVKGLPHANEVGGLSGRPLLQPSLRTISLLKQEVGDSLTLIGCGGVHDSRSAQAMLDAGADLIQLYTALIYQGPFMVKALVDGIASSETVTLSEAN